MAIDKKILNEIERYRSINQYIMEQAAPDPADLDALMAPAPGEIGSNARRSRGVCEV